MTHLRIADADEWTATLRDGFSFLVFELDPGGRIRATGYEHSYDGTEAVFGSTHSPDAIDDLADALKAIAAHARGQKNH